MTEQNIGEKSIKNGLFWNTATKYASASDDESFVEEVAYMMVTLHRTGALIYYFIIFCITSEHSSISLKESIEYHFEFVNFIVDNFSFFA